ncbi:hypothetical protein ACE6H2_018576 [Prunus campanulata]
MSVASKLIRFGTAALFHAPIRTLSATPSLHSLKPFAASQSLRFPRYSSSSAAIETIDSVTANSTEAPLLHPWPEWVAFIDRLKTKGYFTGTQPSESDDVYTDMTQIKDACLSFARDRYDVFKSLSTEDMQAVVEGGCPNLFRKAVNSAKRLRFYLRLDEGDVCGACNLRGSCDRAYVVLKESEAAARTVDIVRILLFHALDPLVISGGNKPLGRDLLETSARKLLSELLQLSETAVDPSLPKPAAKAEKKLSASIIDDGLSQTVEMKRGDWMCPKCNFMNFAKNLRCLQCKEDGPKKADAGDLEMKKGDWICTECNFMNFSRNIRCLKCKAEGPKRVSTDAVEMKNGDWNCPKCAFMNFASNRKCLRCQETRCKINPADWDCPSCNFLNYGRNTVCLKCNCKCPKEATTSEYEEQMWRHPR